MLDDHLYLSGSCWLFKMVSYTKVRAEGRGIECKTGLLARPERVVILAIGLLSQLVSGLLLSWQS